MSGVSQVVTHPPRIHMMRLLAVVFAVAALSGTADSAAAESWLIPADKIYTAPDAAPITDGAVLTWGEGIQSVVDANSRPRIPKGTKTADQCRGVVVAGFQNS